MSEPDTARSVTGEDEVVDLCRDLIRIDTSNYGDHSGPGERKAAEYVAEKLAEVGLEPQIFESHQGRASTVARIEGEDRSRPALLIHGHTDVVPANADDWTHHPFSGEIADGCLWGRGAVDMKDMDAMTLAVVRDRMRSGRKPPARHRAGLPRRRGGGRHVRRAAPRRQAPRPLRGRDGGDQRGRRLLLHRQREPAALPRRDGPEGHALDAADRGRHRRPRLDDPPGQRHHRTVRGRRAARAGTSSRCG